MSQPCDNPFVQELRRLRGIAGSFRSTVCPHCGRRKRAKRSLCAACYHNLPRDMRNALYLGFGDGYEEAFADAMQHLRRQSQR